MLNIQFDYKNLKKEVDDEIKRVVHETISRLQKIGQEYINEAKISGNYNDQTTNLRNAHSYRIYYNGKPIHESIGELSSGEGNPTSKFFDEKITGVGLEFIVGDGMNYASFVEGKYGFNVSETGFQQVEQKVKELFNQNL